MFFGFGAFLIGILLKRTERKGRATNREVDSMGKVRITANHHNILGAFQSIDNNLNAIEHFLGNLDRATKYRCIPQGHKPLILISDLALELFEGDEEKTTRWLMAPNHLFFDRSPFEMAMKGNADTVAETLLEFLGRPVKRPFEEDY